MLDQKQQQQQQRVQQGRSSAALTQPYPRTNWRVLRISWTSLHTHSQEKKRQVCRKLSTDGQTRTLGEASEYRALENTRSRSPVWGESKDALRGELSSQCAEETHPAALQPDEGTGSPWGDPAYISGIFLGVECWSYRCWYTVALLFRSNLLCWLPTGVFGQLQNHIQVVRRS